MNNRCIFSSDPMPIDNLSTLKCSEVETQNGHDWRDNGRTYLIFWWSISTSSSHNEATMLQWELNIVGDQNATETPFIVACIGFPSETYHSLGEACKNRIWKIGTATKIDQWIEEITHPMPQIEVPIWYFIVKRFQEASDGLHYRKIEG